MNLRTIRRSVLKAAGFPESFVAGRATRLPKGPAALPSMPEATRLKRLEARRAKAKEEKAKGEGAP